MAGKRTSRQLDLDEMSRQSKTTVYAQAARNTIATGLAGITMVGGVPLLASTDILPRWSFWLIMPLAIFSFFFLWMRSAFLNCPRCKTNVHVHQWPGVRWIRYGGLPVRVCSECGLDLTANQVRDGG